MAEAVRPESPSRKHCIPHVLVVAQDADYGQLLVIELQSRSIRANHTRTVDAFLDLNSRERVDLVSLEIDVMDPETLEDIKLLRTHFGEGPGTRIVASSSFLPGAFPVLVEQRGADTCMAKLTEPNAMADALEVELLKQVEAKKTGRANELNLS